MILDENGFLQGGNKFLQINFEYYFVINGLFWVVVFVDFVNVYGDDQNFDFDYLCGIVGIELCINVLFFGVFLCFIWLNNFDLFSNMIGEQECFDSFDFSIGISFQGIVCLVCFCFICCGCFVLVWCFLCIGGFFMQFFKICIFMVLIVFVVFVVFVVVQQKIGVIDVFCIFCEFDLGKNVIVMFEELGKVKEQELFVKKQMFDELQVCYSEI